MNLDERQLIANVFDRLRSVGGGPKDRDADQFIKDLVRQFPDAPYYLVQSVLVQEQGFNQADARIAQLEENLRRLESASGAGANSSFLSGVRASTPERPAMPAGRDAETSGDGPWSRSSRPTQDEGRSGGFLSSALSTATGVAGGMFLADSIRSLFGGGRPIWGGDSSTRTGDQAAIDSAQDEAQDAEDDADQAKKQLATDDAAFDNMQDAEEDDGNWNDDSGTDA
jgi:uncharacterized protein